MKKKTRVVGNKGFLATVIGILIVAVVALVISGCGGGGGGTAPVADQEYATISLVSTDKIAPGYTTLAIKGVTSSNNTVNCRIIDFGDGSNSKTEWTQCNTISHASFNHTYTNSTQASLSRNVKVEADNGKHVTTKDLEIWILVAPVSTAISAPNFSGFSCKKEEVTKGEDFECSSDGSCPSGLTCKLYVDFGDGVYVEPYNTVAIEAIPHKYTVVTDNDIKYTVTAYAISTDGTNTAQTTPRTAKITLRPGSVTAPGPLKLTNQKTDYSQSGNDEFHLVRNVICSVAKCVISGTADTNIVKAYALNIVTGAKAEITIASNHSWSFDVTVDSGTEGTKSFLLWGVDKNENPGTKITVDYAVDRKNPETATVFAVTSPTTDSSQTIKGRKLKCEEIIRGTTIVKGISQKDDCTGTEPWEETVGFTSYGTTYQYSYYARDFAGNKSVDPATVSIKYVKVIDDGGNDGGGGDTCTCNHNGTCNSGEDVSCCEDDCEDDETSGSYAVHYGFDADSDTVSISTYDGEIVALRNNGQVKFYVPGGGSTDYEITGSPSLDTPVAIGACPATNQLAIVDWNKNTTGQINVYTIDKDDHKLAYLRSFGYNNAETNGKVNKPTKIACDSSGNWGVDDTGNKMTKKYNPSGVFTCKFARTSAASQDVKFDGTGYMYVPNSSLNRIYVLGPDCLSVGSGSTQTNQVSRPTGVAVNLAGTVLYAADDDGIQIYNPSNPSSPRDLGYVNGNDTTDVLSITNIGTTAYLLKSGGHVKYVNNDN